MAIATMLAGCATVQNFSEPVMPEVSRNAMQKEFDNLPPPATGKPIIVAVYSFSDKTGQRKPVANIATLSTATTQGAETFLIKALQDVGRGRWFRVVERVGIDNLTKERLIIRQMREAYEGPNSQALPPMTFAGVILEGGIVGYDSSVKSGGAAARWLGIGSQTQYSEDTVTVALRATSVATGEVLAAVTVQKTIVSSADSVSALKFFSDGTRAFEAETGLTINEPVTLATKAAVEYAVLEMIKEGKRKGLWSYANGTVPTEVAPPPKVSSTDSAPATRNANSQAAKESVPVKKPEESAQAPAANNPAGERLVVVNAWVRKAPDTNSPPVRNVNTGQSLKVLQDRDDGWSEVEFDDQLGHHRGWTRSSNLAK